MQLFGLVNTMLAHDRITAERDLSIARYAVIPLSPNSGDSPTSLSKLHSARFKLVWGATYSALKYLGIVLTQCASAGLIGWVPNTDTLHALIREYRDARKIPLNVEHRLMLGMAPDYENLTVIQKVEVFEHALESTSGMAYLLPLQLLQA